MKKLWLWASLVLICLLVAGTMLVIKSLSTPGKAAWVIMKSKDSAYHPTMLTVPTPKLPSPNGFDTFVQAGELLKDTDRIADALGVNSTISPTAMQQLVDENSAVLPLFYIGLKQDYLHTPIRSADTKLPFYGNWRGIGRLLALNARVKAAQGDWAGAAQCSLDAIQFGATIPHGGFLITSLVGIAIQELGYRELWPCINHLSAPQA